MLQDTLHHVRGHFLDDIRRVVHVQLVQNFLQLVVGEATDEKLLCLRLHFHEGLRRLFLWKQTEHKGNLLFVQPVKKSGDIHRIHGREDIPESSILFFLQQLQEGFFHDFKALCHIVIPPIHFYLS